MSKYQWNMPIMTNYAMLARAQSNVDLLEKNCFFLDHIVFGWNLIAKAFRLLLIKLSSITLLPSEPTANRHYNLSWNESFIFEGLTTFSTHFELTTVLILVVYEKFDELLIKFSSNLRLFQLLSVNFLLISFWIPKKLTTFFWNFQNKTKTLQKSSKGVALPQL